MASSNRTAYATEETLLERVSRLKSITQRMYILQEQVDTLGEDIVLDIIGGWSTGDALLDFVLVASGGAYDAEVIEGQYRKLSNLTTTAAGQQILVVQKGEHWDGDGLIVLRTIHLATLRQDSLVYDVDTLSLGIPVEEQYLTWREWFKDGLLIEKPFLVSKPWITVGPLYTPYSLVKDAKQDDGDGLFFVPDEACAEVELLPCDHNDLFHRYGIDSGGLSQLYRTWIWAKSTKARST